MKMMISLSSPELTVIEYTGTHGLYSAVPVRNTEAMVELAKELDVETKPEKMHCTVMYSETAAQNIDSVFLMNGVEALVPAIRVQDGHDAHYIVADLVSQELVHAHSALLKAGAVHTYVPFHPHVTLTKLPEGADPEAYKDRIDEINQRLARDPLVLELGLQFIGDLKD